MMTLVREEPPAAARRWVPLLLVALLLTRLVAMAVLPLMDTTEARYAEIGRKMTESGDWVTPWHDEGVPYWGKPPLSFWLTAGTLRLLGTNEFAARLPHLLCTLLTVALVWHLGRKRSPREALLATALLAGSLLFYVGGGAVMTDPALVLGTTLSMLGFWLALHYQDERARGRYRWLLFLGLAIGLLTKGPVALVLVGVPLLLWTLLSRRAAAVWQAIPWLTGAALTALLVAPWYLLAEQRTPGFLRYFLLGEHWHRFVTPGWAGDLYGFAHRVAPGSVWLYALAALLPWLLLLPMAFVHRTGIRASASGAAADWHRFLLLWALWPLIFFTAARNIIWPYVLPSLPALALWGAGCIERRVAPERADRWLAAGLAVTLLASAAVFVIGMHTGRFERESARAVVHAYEIAHGAGEPLFFIERRPSSAAFYSRGRAGLVADGPTLAHRLEHRSAYVAVRSATAQESVRFAFGGAQVHRVGQFGAYELMTVGHDPAGATAATPNERAAPPAAKAISP